MNNDTPTYYAIIPASVRYDNALPMGAKMMYGEITALSNAKGYCFASNGYFSKLYGVTNQAISKWIKQLEKAGHVRIAYVGEQGNQQRRVSIAVASYQPELIGVSTGVEGVSTTVEHNNINSNSTSINNSLSKSEKPESVLIESANNPDWMQVAEEMNEAVKSEKTISRQWEFMKAATGFDGNPLEIFSAWAGKATPYQLRNWRIEFPKLQGFMKPAALLNHKYQRHEKATKNRVHQQPKNETVHSFEEFQRRFSDLQP